MSLVVTHVQLIRLWARIFIPGASTHHTRLQHPQSVSDSIHTALNHSVGPMHDIAPQFQPLRNGMPSDSGLNSLTISRSGFSLDADSVLFGEELTVAFSKEEVGVIAKMILGLSSILSGEC